MSSAELSDVAPDPPHWTLDHESSMAASPPSSPRIAYERMGTDLTFVNAAQQPASIVPEAARQAAAQQSWGQR
jgi:hypothetical protein